MLQIKVKVQLACFHFISLMDFSSISITEHIIHFVSANDSLLQEKNDGQQGAVQANWSIKKCKNIGVGYIDLLPKQGTAMLLLMTQAEQIQDSKKK